MEKDFQLTEDNLSIVEDLGERMQEQISLHYILEQFKTKNQFSINFIRDLEAGPRYYRIDFAKVKMPGGKTGVTMGFRDVDEEAGKQLAVEEAERERNAALEEALGAAEQASKAKTAFLSNMSHEIRTPIIAMTANAFKEDVDAALKAGMQAHIAKPIDIAVLMKTLTDVFITAEDNKDNEEDK